MAKLGRRRGKKIDPNNLKANEKQLFDFMWTKLTDKKGLTKEVWMTDLIGRYNKITPLPSVEYISMRNI